MAVIECTFTPCQVCADGHVSLFTERVKSPSDTDVRLLLYGFMKTGFGKKIQEDKGNQWQNYCD